jgi:glucosamine-6-phosphate deaminase
MNPIFFPQVTVSASPQEACGELASSIADAIRERAKQGKAYVLGLATGSTPIPLYQELIRLHRDDGLSFKNVLSFNLDEYYGLGSVDPNSYHHFMRSTLFDAVAMSSDQWKIPSGEIRRNEIEKHCAEYDKAIADAGGIDLQILGIGRSGHIGFNEPPSSASSPTRLVTLNPITRKDAVAQFGSLENVPEEAITMGVGTILRARQIALLAWGKGKSEILGRAFTSSPGPELPASFLRTHPRVSVYLDREAASSLPSAFSCRTP